MKSLKVLLEKPTFIWVLVAIAYITGFALWADKQDPGPHETRTFEVVKTFAETSFPPTIGVVREFKDWGHVGYYALSGRVLSAVKGDLNKLRVAHMIVVLLAFLLFVKLGHYFTSRNRISPVWVSVGLLILAINPYQWLNAMTVGSSGLLMLLSLLALMMYVYDQLGWAAMIASIAGLVDTAGVLLPIAFIMTRLMEERGRVVRPVRLVYLLLPLVIGALPWLAWKGFVPQGDAQSWLADYRTRASVFRLDHLTYALAILPIYTLWYTWAWGVKARSRALIIGAVAVGLSVPFFFIFPIKADLWELARSGADMPLGLIDELATKLAGEYKNLFLFLPYLAGVFLLAQLAVMDVLDRSRCLQFFIFLFFAVQPLTISSGDRAVSLVIPFVLLLSLSEAMVGEQGNISRV